MNSTSAVGAADEWAVVDTDEAMPLNSGAGASRLQAIDFKDNPRLPICLRGPNNSCRWVTINVASLCFLAGGTALKVANFYQWKSDWGSLLSSIAIGAGVETLAKINLPVAIERAVDEMSMFLASLFFQIVTQSEINTPATPSWKEIWFTALFIHYSAVTVSHVTNLFSADPALFGTGDKEGYRALLEGDARKFVSILKSQTPLVIASIALITLGIVKREALLVNLGTFLGTYSAGTAGTQQVLEVIQTLRKSVTAQIHGDVHPPTGF